MSEEALRDAMNRAMEKTFDELCFALTDDEEPEGDLPLEGSVRIGFSGTHQGHFVIALRGRLLKEFVMNMLGEDDEPSREDCLDGLGEIANVMCAHTLTEWLGAEAIFELAPPEVSEGESDAGTSAALVLFLEEGVAEASISLEGQG